MADDIDNKEELNIDPPELVEGESDADTESRKGTNSLIRQMMDQNYLEYAAYVIKERAIPDVDDGLKPVQRRILWSMHTMDDGKFHKVANIIGQTMQYHPHGDASIGDALVVLANKEYFIDRQGNFGNILTGDGAAASRYIEGRLSGLGREVLFNEDLTDFVETYDGRKKEPVVLPVKIPALLLLGSEGIAVGMSTKIMPHNFCELLEAQIAELKGEEYELYPDFPQGGLMDVSEYEEGNGKIKLRARIDIDGRKLIIREIPALTTTEKLIASIEKEVEKNRLKIAAINDYTGENIEIEIVPSRGQDPEKTMQALYAYTHCSITESVNMLVICDNKPVIMDVKSVIRRNTEKLLDYLKRELENELHRCNEEAHRKTLAQIFIENRIYKDIEECEALEEVTKAVYDGVMKFREQLMRDVSDEDITMLLAIPIRRISLFDIRKNEQEIADIHKRIKEIRKHLKALSDYAIAYLQSLLDKYGKDFPRRTELVGSFRKIDRREVALNNVKVGWDRKNGYIGTNVKSDDTILCNEFDKLLCIERKGDYKIINIPDKIYGGKLYEFRKFDPEVEFGVIYRDNSSGKAYGKRCVVDKFITDRVYRICPENCRLELITPRPDAIYELTTDSRRKDSKTLEVNLKELPLRSPRARGQLLSAKPVLKVTHLRYLTEEELAAFSADIPPVDDDDSDNIDNIDNTDDANGADGSEVVAVETAPDEIAETEEVAETDEPDVSGEPVQEDEEPEQPAPKPKAPRRKKTTKVAETAPIEPQEEEPEPVEPEKEEEPEPDNAPEPPAVEAKPEPSPEPAPETEPEPEPEPEKKNNDENWGIIQPEFGF